MGAMVVDERRNLDAVAARLIANTPAARAAAARAALAALRPRLARAIANALGQSRRDTINLERRLRSAGPAETLSRGYAIVTTADGSLLRSIAVAPVGTVLNLQLSDGNLPVRVEIPEALRKKKDA
jgi:exodeoxyribonuclease VII large subunit